MKIKHDPQADALYIQLSSSPVAETDEVAPGVIVDYNQDHGLVGIEILSVSQRAEMPDLANLVLETVKA
jgi:uncharacterized protein YuzE